MRIHKFFYSFLPLLVLVFLFVEVSAAVRVDTSNIVGGWRPIKDINSTFVGRAGHLAIEEYNKVAKLGLKFSGVVSGELQVVSGILTINLLQVPVVLMDP